MPEHRDEKSGESLQSDELAQPADGEFTEGERSRNQREVSDEGVRIRYAELHPVRQKLYEE